MGFDMLTQSLYVLAHFWTLVACNLFALLLVVDVDMANQVGLVGIYFSTQIANMLL